MISTDDVELLAVRSSFCFLVARWRLTQSDVAKLLGETAGPFPQSRILPDVLDSPAESRMRLLIRLDQALTHLTPDDDIAMRLRDGSAMEGSSTTLDALHNELTLRAAIRIAEKLIEDRPTGKRRPDQGTS